MSTHYTPFLNIKKNPKLSHICNYGICSKGPKNEFETAMVNEPSVFEPLKFYCICLSLRKVYTNTEDCGSHRSKLPYLFGYKTEFFLPKQSQTSRSVL